MVKFHYCIYDSQAFVSILIWLIPSYSFNIHFNIINPHTLASSKWSPYFKFSNHNHICIEISSYVCRMSHLWHLPWYDQQDILFRLTISTLFHITLNLQFGIHIICTYCAVLYWATPRIISRVPTPATQQWKWLRKQEVAGTWYQPMDLHVALWRQKVGY